MLRSEHISIDAEPVQEAPVTRLAHFAGDRWVLKESFKALRKVHPEYELWRDFPYEYEHDRLAIDLINGSELLRQWVDDPAAEPGDLEAIALADERAWDEQRERALLYV